MDSRLSPTPTSYAKATAVKRLRRSRSYGGHSDAGMTEEMMGAKTLFIRSGSAKIIDWKGILRYNTVKWFGGCHIKKCAPRMKNTKVIDFTGMEFKRETHPSSRLRQRSEVYRTKRGSNTSNNVAKNVRNIFQSLLGF